MRTIKDKKGIHSQYGGKIHRYGTKDERRIARHFFKSLRHKLRMHIPLSALENKVVDEFSVTENYQLDSNGDMIKYMLVQKYMDG